MALRELRHFATYLLDPCTKKAWRFLRICRWGPVDVHMSREPTLLARVLSCIQHVRACHAPLCFWG
jgi:hypothetical protein